MSGSMSGEATCDWQNSKITLSPPFLPLNIYTLENTLPFNVDRTCKDDGISVFLIRLHYTARRKGFLKI